MKRESFEWPKGFLWGSATAAHQVEGGNVNNWSQFELGRALSLAQSAKERYQDFSAWPDIKNAATNPDNYASGKACDHYHRYEEDFDIMQSLGLNAFRFSVEWSRLEPEGGKWNAEAFAHYKKYIHELKSRGIEPVMTLYHWTHPLWFDEKGAFAKRANVRYFLRFVDKVAESFGTDVQYVCTINEPDTVMMQGYIQGNHAPGVKRPCAALRAYANLLWAHKKARLVWKTRFPKAMVGFTKTFAAVRPANKKLTSRVAARLDYLLRDDIVMRYQKRSTDFIGVQFYFTDYYDGFRTVSADLPRSDLHWPMQPENLALILQRLGRWDMPLLVTETGVADAQDQYRAHWIEQTIRSVQTALESNVKVTGYLYWSLLDNFEWAEGKWPRFGLVEVDYAKGLTRRVRNSAKQYGAFVKTARK